MSTITEDLKAASEKEPILQFFAFDHLPAHLQVISRGFAMLAIDNILTLPRNAERTVALRKLLEAKDCAVRAFIFKSVLAPASPAICETSPRDNATSLPAVSEETSLAQPENGAVLCGSPRNGETSSAAASVVADNELAGHPEYLKLIEEPIAQIEAVAGGGDIADIELKSEGPPPLDAVADGCLPNPTQEAVTKVTAELPADDQSRASPLLAEPRQLTGHIVNPANDRLSVSVLDAPGSGGACHSYVIDGFNTANNPSALTPHGKPITMRGVKLLFQNGPINEAGVNGITHEALIEILIDRLKGFQEGPYAGSLNSAALHHLKQAQTMLRWRTEERMKRGVEGTHKV
jgi:hypothetical protein